MLGGPSGEAEAEVLATGNPSALRRAVLAVAVLAALSVPASASAAPPKAAAKLRAASAPVSELKPVAAVPLPGGATLYRFQQRVSGVQVLNAQAVVSDPKGAPPALVADSSKPSIDGVPSPQVGRAAAVEIATRAAQVRRLRAHLSARLAIAPGTGGTLVWRVVIPSAQPLGDFELLIDAVSGAVVRTQDLLQDSRRGHAQLFNPNPVAQARSGSTLRDRHDKNYGRLTSLRHPVTLHDIRRGQRCLRGKWVHATLGRDGREVCKRDLNWQGVKRSKERFEALMAYFHIDRAQRYIQSLGFGTGDAKGINKRTQTVVADAFGDDNSFFSPATRKVKYGSGGVDDAEDADVILHEYGHTLQDDQLRHFGEGEQAGAIGEGFSDYWAAVMSSRVRGTSNRDDVCIFDWDGVTWGRFVPAFNRRCGRRADNDDTLEEGQDTCGFEIHCVGEVWSSALWDLRREIGGRSFDRIVLASHFYYTRTNEHFDEAVEALIFADQDLGGENQDAICAEMETQRGIDVADCP